ncbi:hypothetical protein AB0N29_07390 [Nocardioides sp. NPDC092400]|uniref:hypothetical protein n=1 Tax=Nocardioides sp. NPDC092400 TaxID=3155196 RepID=UPI0034134C6C
MSVDQVSSRLRMGWRRGAYLTGLEPGELVVPGEAAASTTRGEPTPADGQAHPVLAPGRGPRGRSGDPARRRLIVEGLMAVLALTALVAGVCGALAWLVAQAVLDLMAGGW